uniref:C-type lectin domain-containing protein n=1 Tax=Strigops habroptila TaxID=2489341 RepID=A0A672V7Y8_STRHB
MAQSLVYADLRFAKVVGGRTMASQALEAGKSPWDPQAAPSIDACGLLCLAGRWSCWWCLPAGLMATCLLLLVATVVLGACYWQVTRSLRDASREHAAEQGRLEQELSAREQRLEQARLELAWARAELGRTWRDGNSSRAALELQDMEMGRARQELAELHKDMQRLQGELNSSESTVASLPVPLPPDCCPSGWLLYRGKCLFVSSEKKTWEDSRDECEKKYAQLLITKSWSRWTVPTFLKNADIPYWIGLQKSIFPWYDYGWLEEEDPDDKGVSDAWFWVDGSLYERYPAAEPPVNPPILHHGFRKWSKSHRYPVPGTSTGQQKASKQLRPRVGGRSGVMRCLEEVQMGSQDLGGHVQRMCKQEAVRGDKETRSFM